ncbi:MAG: ABC transporter substrate-binding protein [Atribacterota bacterium]|nr:ABC transporter substrate-binding protein [Atribacterota bacterium]
MFSKKILTVIFISFLLAVLSIIGSAEEIIINDILGREVSIPNKVERILAVGSSLREIVAFNVAEKVVGIEYREKSETDEKGVPQGSDLPYMLAYPELYDLPVVNIGVGGSGFNHEIIIQLKPDVIFMGASDRKQVDDLMNKTKIPVVAVYTNPVGTPGQDKLFFDSLEIIGEVLNKQEKAAELINIIKDYAFDLEERTKGISEVNKVNAYIGGRAFFGSHGITGTDPQWPPFNLINVKNVAFELSDLSSGINVDKEALVGWNPDIIFISPVSLSTLESDLKTSPFSELKAVKEKEVYYVLPYCWYSYNKENLIANAYYVGKTVYPELFQDVDIDEKSIEIYNSFYNGKGENAYIQLKDRFGAFKKYE